MSLQIREIRCAEFILRLSRCMPPPQAALRAALVTAMAFPHHKAQEKIEKRPHLKPGGTAGPGANKLCQSR